MSTTAIVQALLAALSLTTLYMSMGDNPRHRRAAPFVGICAQPFWLYSTIQAGQVGMVLLCLAYTSIYAMACWRNRPRRES